MDWLQNYKVLVKDYRDRREAFKEAMESWAKRHPNVPQARGVKDLLALAGDIGMSALVSYKGIIGAVAEVTDEWAISEQLDFAIRLEMLWFFLHIVDRYAFGIGGPEFRAALQDEIAVPSIQAMVTASFVDSSDVEEGFDAKAWESRMVSDLIEEYNNSTLDYSMCKELGVKGLDSTNSEEVVFGQLNGEETILAKLAGRINRLVSEEFDVLLRVEVWHAAMIALVKSDLKEQVEAIYSIRNDLRL
ncbi:MAG: hypothetical protein U9R48_01020 [Chloroflexota bacterium]|nr:hypothetical protein [Chloroflexota bacterium]